MGKSLFRFSVIFLLVLLLCYFLHTWTIQFFSFSSNSSILNLSYVFNAVYTILLIIAILILRRKFKDQIGFIFLAGSFIKLGVFVGITKLNGIEMDKSVFLDFFIPYVISLILEVYYISKILNSSK
ncbi:DUF6168 family protein [Aquimarina sp. 2201CG14-23]|uniref:DUF6168 family protein n=1 Tax=Aquimarina mycalae TaxID=3040073 RepID=UPI002477D8BB|nr:DUF6168 family protein [Aquimarina sp. 2201CG14-23]MDH7446400.1 DUF6168 family protein [Aquimarina sp. 2201CG14-23]